MTDNTQAELRNALRDFKVPNPVTGNEDYFPYLWVEPMAAFIVAHTEEKVREALLDELQDIDTQRDHNMSRFGGHMSEADADNLATSRIKDRITELEKQLKTEETHTSKKCPVCNKSTSGMIVVYNYGELLHEKCYEQLKTEGDE